MNLGLDLEIMRPTIFSPHLVRLFQLEREKIAHVKLAEHGQRLEEPFLVQPQRLLPLGHVAEKSKIRIVRRKTIEKFFN